MLVLRLAEMRTSRNAAFLVTVPGIAPSVSVLRWGVPSVAQRRKLAEDHGPLEGVAA